MEAREIIHAVLAVCLRIGTEMRLLLADAVAPAQTRVANSARSCRVILHSSARKRSRRLLGVSYAFTYRAGV
jgi:hypothetical protein